MYGKSRISKTFEIFLARNCPPPLYVRSHCRPRPNGTQSNCRRAVASKGSERRRSSGSNSSSPGGPFPDRPNPPTPTEGAQIERTHAKHGRALNQTGSLSGHMPPAKFMAKLPSLKPFQDYLGGGGAWTRPFGVLGRWDTISLAHFPPSPDGSATSHGQESEPKCLRRPFEWHRILRRVHSDASSLVHTRIVPSSPPEPFTFGSTIVGQSSHQSYFIRAAVGTNAERGL
mmetsp:Transcript_54960/g.97893  ORF Transcript_54960/g.97893 Transcript_54960/m.97893 type:complete len:229 (+) Transcript_54960:788-1474(+)